MSSTPERIAVFGAGVMGAGIAQVMAIAGHEVRCIDISDTALDAGRATVDGGRYGLRSAVARGRLTDEEADAALRRITFSTDADAARDVLLDAARVDATHPQPHLLLSQVYFRLGLEEDAAREKEIASRLRRHRPETLESIPGRTFGGK